MIWDSPQCDLPPHAGAQTANKVVVLTRGGILKIKKTKSEAQGWATFVHARADILVPPVETLRGWPKEWTGVNHMHSMTMRFDRLR